LPILTDTSFFIALARPREDDHLAAVAALRAVGNADLAMPVTLLSETMGLVLSRWGIAMQRQLWDAFTASGIDVVPVDAGILARAREIDERYADAGFGFADCTLLAACEELRTARVLSFDRRLAAYRPSFAPGLEVLP
jgi:predicted nucleic acid-binding protein